MIEMIGLAPGYSKKLCEFELELELELPNGTEVNAAGRNVCACRSTMQTNRQISYFIFRISYLASDWYGTANRKQ